MAEENKDNQSVASGDKGPQPAFDAEQLRKVMREEIQQHLSTQDKDSVNLDQTPTAGRPQPSENPLAAIIEPVVGPALRNIDVKASAAYDASIFYAFHPEALKYQAEIEAAFNQLIQQGTPFKHEAVWEWYRGKNFDKFMKEQQEADAAKIANARDVTTIDGGIRPSGGGVKQAFGASDDELKVGLKDVAF